MNFYFEEGRVDFEIENITEKPRYPFQITRVKQIPFDLEPYYYIIIPIEKQSLVIFNFQEV